MFKKVLVIFGAVCTLVIAWSGVAAACGGFFCQNQPVDQTGERIVYTVNDDGTITTLIEIQYQGEAADFSWILPIPEAITADDLAVPDDGQAVFDELHQLTDVQFIPRSYQAAPTTSSPLPKLRTAQKILASKCSPAARSVPLDST